MDPNDERAKLWQAVHTVDDRVTAAHSAIEAIPNKISKAVVEGNIATVRSPEFWAALFAAASADTHRPQTPVTGWFVENGSYPDRPMYSVTNGVRETKANGEKATVGDKCRCDPPYRIDEGRTTYCALDGRVPTPLALSLRRCSCTRLDYLHAALR